MAQGEPRPREAVNDLCMILEAGKNVVTPALISLYYPPFANQQIRQRIEAAISQLQAKLEKLVREVMLGAGNPVLKSGRCVTVQAPGGTGALRVAADFIRGHCGAEAVGRRYRARLDQLGLL